MSGNIDDIKLGTASTIQVVTDLPTTGVQNYQQGTLFKLPSGQIFRLTKPIFKATPTTADFELLFASGKTPLSDSDIIIVNGDTDFDMAGLAANTELLVICTADAELSLRNTRVINKRDQDNLSTATGGPGGTRYTTGLNLVAGEVFYIIYKSPTESYYEKLRDPNLAEAAVRYWAEYWVSSEKGLSTNHGQSIEAPYQSVHDFLAGWIDFGSRVNLMSDYGHAGGWTLPDQNYITFQGSGKSCMMYGGIELTGVCEHVTFRDLTIANDATWGGQQAIKFSDVGGKHVVDNLWTDGNTAAYYLEFGVNCYNSTADGITTFGALACTIRDSDLTGSTGIIKLNDLGAGQFAYIKLENTQVSGVEVGTGWYVLYDGSSDLGTLTYTGSGSIYKVIPTSNSVPQKIGGLLTRDLNKLLIEIQPTAENQVLKSSYFLGNLAGLQWVTATDYPGVNSQVIDQSGSNMTAMLHQFRVAEGNYQSFDIVVDIWEHGVGSGIFSRYVKLSGAFRMDVIEAAGVVDINDYIDKDQSTAPKGTLSLNWVSGGYGGAAVELQFQILVPFTRLNINKRVLTHSFGTA